MDYLQFIFQAINNLLTQNLGFFDAMGQNLFRAFATILVVWFGVKSALSSAGGRHTRQDSPVRNDARAAVVPGDDSPGAPATDAAGRARAGALDDGGEH